MNSRILIGIGLVALLAAGLLFSRRASAGEKNDSVRVEKIPVVSGGGGSSGGGFTDIFREIATAPLGFFPESEDTSEPAITATPPQQNQGVQNPRTEMPRIGDIPNVKNPENPPPPTPTRPAPTPPTQLPPTRRGTAGSSVVRDIELRRFIKMK